MKKKTLLFAATTAILAMAAAGVGAQTDPVYEAELEEIAVKVANETVQGGYKLLTMAQLKKMIDAKEDLLLLDAHPPEEFVKGHVVGAVNFGFLANPVGKWEQDALGKSKNAYLKALGPNLNRKIVFYCGFTKCGRSHAAAQWAKEFGYTNLYRVPGGVRAWRNYGFPLVTIDDPQ